MNAQSRNDNFYALLAVHFPQDRQRCALEVPTGRSYTWEDIERLTAQVANLITALDLPAGARIAAQVEKSPEALLLYLAVLRSGHVYLPLNTAYQASELAYFIADAEPALLVCAPQRLDEYRRLLSAAALPHPTHLFTLGGMDEGAAQGSLLEAAAAHSERFDTVARGPDDLAALLYTSGTTGRSKGAMLTHANLAANAQVLQHYWHWQADDVLLHALPLFHVHGLFVAAHGALLNGSKMVFLPRFNSDAVIRLLPQATVFMGVPTFYTRLLTHPDLDAKACRGMRLFVSGSAPLLASTFNDFAARTGHVILERYGMSETLMLTSNPYQGPRKAGTVGLPLPNVALRITPNPDNPLESGDIGEIQVCGPSVFTGYWRMPDKTEEAFTADGYFKTGDLGMIDAQGYVSIVGRDKDLIISGGYNVYPKEVEGVLDAHPGVLESAVIGVPDADYGEAVVAALVLQPDAVFDEAAMKTRLKQELAGYKTPKRIVCIKELPRNTMGKVQKNRLREWLAS